MAPRLGKVILTGATGFLGSHLMDALLERGERLAVLGRSGGGRSLAERIGDILTWFGRSNTLPPVETAEVDFLRPRCGMDSYRYRQISVDADLIIHCASDTTFSEQNREASVRSNVESLSAILELAAGGPKHLCYVSSAYSAGITGAPCLENLPEAEQFHNVYEETKALAEREVASHCLRHGIPFTIIRPSIVYGDSRTGRANRFNAIYHHVRSLACIRDIYLNDIRKQGGRKSAALGISLGTGGILHLPLTLNLSRPGTVNLIPVDYFVAATLAILDSGEQGNIYHLTNPTPSTTAELARYCERFLAMEALEISYSAEIAAPSPPEELFNRFIQPYRPYLADIRRFDRANTDRLTGGLQPPPLTYDIFARCMDYAVSVNWGKTDSP